MEKMTKEEFEEVVKSERKLIFKPAYDCVYDVYDNLGYLQKDDSFFKQNASMIIETVRKQCWDNFTPLEKEFTSNMLEKLIDEKKITSMSSVQAVKWFASTYPEHIYSLSLSNTQSRRSRAGKEFEAIIEILLAGAHVMYESQGNIGKKAFEEKGLGKLVDVVIPNSVGFKINKFNSVLISAKTTLRERWQEVPEEMGRTGAGIMYLATLDPKISDDIIKTLYEANIQLVTTKSNKDTNYNNSNSVLTFEELLSNSESVIMKWQTYSFTEEENQERINSLNKAIKKHTNHPFIRQYFETIVEEIINKKADA